MPAFARQPAVLSVWALALLLGATTPLPAAAPLAPTTPRDELLRFVPEDVGFCLVVQDVRAHAAALSGSPFAEQFRRSAQGKALAGSPELRKLAALEKVLEAQVGIGWAGLRDDVLGEAIVFAYRPGPPGKAEQEQGLILVRARTEKALASVVDRLNKAQKQTGELRELTEREYKGAKYYRRAERAQVNYYYVRGPILVFSGQEDVLRQAIAREQLATAAQPPVTARLRKLGIERAVVALWLNPRAWDAEVSARAVKPGDAGARTFAVCWKALSDVGVALHLERELTVFVAIHARTAELPPSARKFLAEASRPTELWQQFPDNALLALGGRIDAAALFDFLGEFMSKQARQQLHADLERTLGAMLGKNVVKEVLPALGPDWGLCVTAPPVHDKSWAPRATFALRVGKGDPLAPVDQALQSALHTWAVLGVLAHNKQQPERPISLKSTLLDKHKVEYLAGDSLPPGVQPAFALKGGYLVLASSLDEVRRFGAVPVPATRGAVLLLRVSVKDWRAYLKDRREPLAAALAARDKITREQASARLDALRANLELVDRIEARQHARAGQVTIALTITAAQALRK